MSGAHRSGRTRPRRTRYWVTGAVALVLAVAGVLSWRATGSTTPNAAGNATRSAANSGAAAPAHTSPHGTGVPSSSPPSGTRSASPPWLGPAQPGSVAHLRRGSDPSALPGPLLIADKLNNRLIVVDPHGRIRWQFPRPGDRAQARAFKIPDDAFFTPDGRYIIATQEDDYVISLISVATHRIVYRYGTPGVPGSGANQLDNPDDAIVLPNHDILLADIKNCRLLLIAPGAHRPARIYGRTTRWCRHQPPTRWGSPNGAFPMRNGHYLITEINGDWVDELGLNGHVSWSVHPPGVAYPSDTNEISPGRYLTTDYSSPGQVVIFNRAGRALWRYHGAGRDTLDHPSLALPLPNGDVILNDDFNHRVIVIDPHTDKIVWQYGVTGRAGSAPGYLNNPDGIDLVPPHSLLMTAQPG